ncbi:MAG: glutamate formimidoyltransferase [Candidatus Limnocylindrales bacterium]
MSWFECVPNFSEGRDQAKIAKIAAEAQARPGVALLDVEQNADHNRCVVTLVGEGPALVDAVLNMMRAATTLIDLTSHKGEHPRMGATDVVPFVPLGDATTEQAVDLAVQLGTRVWEELHIPVYLYGDAARRPERRDLAKVRAGQFEGIRDAIGTDPDRRPDIGEPRVHPTAGAVAIGARPVLIAYNAYLTTPDVAVAKQVARAVRGRDGGLTEVKALGFEIRERQRAQVSMNLTDYRRTPIHRAVEAVRREAARFGVGVEETEVVGLVPENALFDAAEYYLQLNNFDRGTVLERKVRGAQPAPESLPEFTARLAARTPTPGGGSAAAAAGAMGAALGEMVMAYSAGKDDRTLDGAREGLVYARSRFLALVGQDSQAYADTVTARRAAKAQPGPEAEQAWTAAIWHAADVPLETARLAWKCAGELKELADRVRSVMKSDWSTALALLDAAREGAIANVVINADDLRERGADIADLETAVRELS